MEGIWVEEYMVERYTITTSWGINKRMVLALLILSASGLVLGMTLAHYVSGESVSNHTKNKIILDYNDPNIPTLIHDNDTSP